MNRYDFGRTRDGAPVDLFVLTGEQGITARITSYGGIVTSLLVPDRHGRLDDIVLGHDSLDEYLASSSYVGCITGRYANRIARGRFTLHGIEYALACNNGTNHLHGGAHGFDTRVWAARDVTSPEGPGLELVYLSKDGEEGYPGNLQVTVTYVLTRGNALRIDYVATTDRPTIVNLTNHSYFNLAGSGDILNHELMIAAERYLPIDDSMIPIGELEPVAGTPFDFTRPTAIGARIDAEHEQLAAGHGYDHTFVLERGDALALAAQVHEPTSGRVMDVLTTEPGIQLYTGNFLNSVTGKGGKVYQRRHGLCLETQHFPDSPNQPGFPSVVLEPGAEYRTTTVYRFSAR